MERLILPSLLSLPCTRRVKKINPVLFITTPHTHKAEIAEIHFLLLHVATNEETTMKDQKFNDGKWCRDLQCNARRMEYDFETRTGILHLGVMNCTSMGGCIRLFQSIDPEVRIIYTFSASCEDTAYYRKNGTDLWRAVVGGRFDMHAQPRLDDQVTLGQPRVSDWHPFPVPFNPNASVPPWEAGEQRA